METEYIYIAVRTDLPLADQVCQVAHAAHLAGKKFPFGDNTHLVLLKVKNEQKLFNLADELDSAGVLFELFYEPDDEMGFTALATQAIIGHQRELFGRYHIWK